LGPHYRDFPLVEFSADRCEESRAVDMCMVRDKWTDAELRVVAMSLVQDRKLDGRGGGAGDSAFNLSASSTQERGGTEMSGDCPEWASRCPRLEEAFTSGRCSGLLHIIRGVYCDGGQLLESYFDRCMQLHPYNIVFFQFLTIVVQRSNSKPALTCAFPTPDPWRGSPCQGYCTTSTARAYTSQLAGSKY